MHAALVASPSIAEQQKILISREEKKDRYEEYSGIEEHFLTGQEVMDPEGKLPESLFKITEQLEMREKKLIRKKNVSTSIKSKGAK